VGAPTSQTPLSTLQPSQIEELSKFSVQMLVVPANAVPTHIKKTSIPEKIQFVVFMIYRLPKT
jgi:hypothetical protein